ASGMADAEPEVVGHYCAEPAYRRVSQPMVLMESDVHVAPRKKTSPRLETREIAMAPPLATFEDSALIKLALEGQTECFTVLTNRHLHAVRRRIASIVPNTTDADDLLQEVLLKVWRHLSTFRSESTFRTLM